MLWLLGNHCFSKWRRTASPIELDSLPLLMRVDKKEARDFYMVETINNKWGTRELERQIHSLLFERLDLSKDKKKILELSKEGEVIREGKRQK